MVQKVPKSKRLLIVGGSGFVGSSLREYIKDKRTNISNIISYSRTEGKNFLHLKKLPKFDYLIYCINNKNKNQSIKLFLHFEKLLNKHPKKVKILFFSSGAVYGPRNKIKKIKESDKLSDKFIEKFTGYKKNYAKEKKKLEKKFKKLALKGYKISIVRGFTFYGKHILKYNYLISQLINAINNKEKILVNNVNIFRSYMHADDMCKWLLKILENSSIRAPTYNLGSGERIKIIDLINFLNNKYGEYIVPKKNKIGPIDYYIPSVNLAKKQLKLKNTINFFRAIKFLIK